MEGDSGFFELEQDLDAVTLSPTSTSRQPRAPSSYIPPINPSPSPSASSSSSSSRKPYSPSPLGCVYVTDLPTTSASSLSNFAFPPSLVPNWNLSFSLKFFYSNLLSPIISFLSLSLSLSLSPFLSPIFIILVPFSQVSSILSRSSNPSSASSSSNGWKATGLPPTYSIVLCFRIFF